MKPDSILHSVSDVSYNFSPQVRINIRLRQGNIKEQLATLENNWKSVAGSQILTTVSSMSP
jgi:hypothetical protein